MRAEGLAASTLSVRVRDLARVWELGNMMVRVHLLGFTKTGHFNVNI